MRRQYLCVQGGMYILHLHAMRCVKWQIILPDFVSFFRCGSDKDCVAFKFWDETCQTIVQDVSVGSDVHFSGGNLYQKGKKVGIFLKSFNFPASGDKSVYSERQSWTWHVCFSICLLFCCVKDEKFGSRSFLFRWSYFEQHNFYNSCWINHRNHCCISNSNSWDNRTQHCGNHSSNNSHQQHWALAFICTCSPLSWWFWGPDWFGTAQQSTANLGQGTKHNKILRADTLWQIDITPKQLRQPLWISLWAQTWRAACTDPRYFLSMQVGNALEFNRADQEWAKLPQVHTQLSCLWDTPSCTSGATVAMWLNTVWTASPQDQGILGTPGLNWDDQRFIVIWDDIEPKLGYVWCEFFSGWHEIAGWLVLQGKCVFSLTYLLFLQVFCAHRYNPILCVHIFCTLSHLVPGCVCVPWASARNLYVHWWKLGVICYWRMGEGRLWEQCRRGCSGQGVHLFGGMLMPLWMSCTIGRSHWVKHRLQISMPGTHEKSIATAEEITFVWDKFYICHIQAFLFLNISNKNKTKQTRHFSHNSERESSQHFSVCANCIHQKEKTPSVCVRETQGCAMLFCPMDEWVSKTAVLLMGHESSEVSQFAQCMFQGRGRHLLDF